MHSSGDIREALEGPHLPAHVYVHVPFCRVKCSYCDFASTEDISHESISQYLLALEGETKHWHRSGVPGVIETVYVGGGTPTILAGGAIRALQAVLEKFPLRPDAEITVEANPDSASELMIEGLAAAGTTRVSMGVQSFVPRELAVLGRVHLVDEAVKAARRVGAAGLDLSVDVMCGIPGQTPASWTESLEKAVDTGAGHLSVYPLALEDGTPLDVAVGTGLTEAPDPDVTAELMLMAEEFLTMEGYERYEIANYARPGQECRHNIAYWTGRTYVGFGPAAHGMLDTATAELLFGESGEGAVRARVGNVPDLNQWAEGVAPEIEWLGPEEAAREDAMMGLRMSRGIDDALVEAADVRGVVVQLQSDGLLEYEDGTWRLTRRGWLLGNEVFGAVWTS